MPLSQDPRLQALARRGGEAETELLNRLPRHVALRELLARPRPCGTRELFAEVPGGQIVDLLQRLPQLRIAPAVGGIAIDRFRNGHPDFLRKQPYGFSEAGLLLQL